MKGSSAKKAQFARTLDAGSSLLGDALGELGAGESVVGRRADDLPAASPTLGGEIAFKLHDTYGFPIDLTVELAAERGVAVDRAGFESALAEQRERSRGGKKAALAEIAVTTALYEEILRRVGRQSSSVTNSSTLRAQSWLFFVTAPKSLRWRQATRGN